MFSRILMSRGYDQQILFTLKRISASLELELDILRACTLGPAALHSLKLEAVCNEFVCEENFNIFIIKCVKVSLNKTELPGLKYT